ncbi:L-fucose:H+ symporter permease [Niabella insulamsoli]|uniref:L-fucose:H+ symporter permease n=1 Tax=Niabella insulamsoli TaxID=3144874 RepID=UPI0031FBCF69
MSAPTNQQKEHLGFIPAANFVPFTLVTMLFLIWGIPNNLNDILIKQFMKSFELSRFQAGFIQSAFYMGYFLLAIPSGLIMKRYSYKVGLVLGLFLFAVGCFLFWPAALAGAYNLFLLALFIIASGLTFLETGANIFIVEMGRPQSAERRLNFSQAFNPIGAILGVLVGTVFIFSGIEHDADKIAAMKLAGNYQDYLDEETMRVVTPYIVLSIFSLLWMVFILLTKFPKLREEGFSENAKQASAKALLKYPYFYRGVLSQFFYCGAQIGTWSFFIQYVQDYTGYSEKTGGYFLTGTLVAFGVGRFTATYLMKYFRPEPLMALFSLINVGLVAVAVANPGLVGAWCIFFTSFFMSLMYPTNFALSIRGLGANTKIAGSIMVMAIVGGAFFPPVMGFVAEHLDSMAWAMIVPLLCYLYIGYYAAFGSKMH